MSKPYNPNDRLARKAKELGYRARSVFKLNELNAEFHLLKPGMTVLDLGAAPGSWLQYVSDQIGPEGRAVGLDLKPIAPISSNVATRVCDLLNPIELGNCFQSVGLEQFNLVLSDLAPNTSGIKYLDQQRSLELNQAVFEIAKKYLKPNGKLVMKIFQGPNLGKFVNELKRRFTKVVLTKPSASRERSSEQYIICS